VLKLACPTAHPIKYLLSKKLVCYNSALIFFCWFVQVRIKKFRKSRNIEDKEEKPSARF
jgi:hypothetical protein